MIRQGLKVVAVLAATTPLFSIGAQAAGSQSLLFGYCGDISRGLGSASIGSVERAAIEIPRELAELWAGNRVTQIYVGYGSSSENEVTVFVSDALDQEPVYTQTATIEQQNGWNIIPLDTPYEVTGSEFFIGYGSYINETTDRPIGIDDNKNEDPYGGWIEIDGNWDNYSRFFGNVCIRIVLEGDSLPQDNATLSGVYAPALVQEGLPFSITLEILNNGVKEISDVKAEIAIGDNALEGLEISFPEGAIPSEGSGTVNLSGLVCYETGKRLPMTVKLTEINGNPNEALVNTDVKTAIDCAEKCFPLHMVVEEFTGTWCGFCPRGIVGMKYMEENYGDKGFIGIAVHYGDEMQVTSYDDLALYYYRAEGYPTAVVNRNTAFDPSKENMLELYDMVDGRLIHLGVAVQANYDEETNILQATATTEFSFSEARALYSLAFVITENDMGPYVQTNYFSEGRYGEMGGWQDEPLYVPTMYNEVARDIKDLYGISGSIPVSVAAMTPYEYTTELPMDNVVDIDKCQVIAIVIDNQTGYIVNAAKTLVTKTGAGVDALLGEDSSLIKVFNPQGLKILETRDASLVNSLPHGIYIINGKKVKL